MARRLSCSLSRALKELSLNHRVTVNPVLFYPKINKCQIGTHGFCTTIIKRNQNAAIEPAKPLELPAILTEEMDKELVPTEDYPKYFPPTFNFAAYIDKSETLQKFVELGVNLSKIEKKNGLPQFVLRLDFNRDVKGHLMFLHELGVPAENMGEIVTKNPLFFKNSLDDLETRLYYLRSKNFELEQVQTIVIKDPFWLNFSTTRIDRRLGWFQKNFGLTGSDVRFLATKFPKVITSSLMHVREIVFSVKEEMGFDKDETKVLLLALPKLFMKSKLIKLNRLEITPNSLQEKMLFWSASIMSTTS